MAAHTSRFLRLVDDAKTRIAETTIANVEAMLRRGEDFHLIDVREESEFASGHLPKAIHLGKGVIERDIEKVIPDVKARMILYCGGGFRSALAADSLRAMGYENAVSMDGGVRAWREAGFPMILDNES